MQPPLVVFASRLTLRPDELPHPLSLWFPLRMHRTQPR
jgi:hypothetical protein